MTNLQKHRPVTSIQSRHGYGGKKYNKAIWEHEGKFYAKGIPVYSPTMIDGQEYAEVFVIQLETREAWHVK